MSGLSVQQSKQGGNNAARFICKSARLAANAGELLDVLKDWQSADFDPAAAERKGYYDAAREKRDALIKKING